MTGMGSLHQLLSGRSSSDGQTNRSNSLGRNVASFDAKFAAVPITSDVGGGTGTGGGGGGGGGVASGRGSISSGSIPVVLSSSSIASSVDESDHTLTGNWEQLWETRLQRCECTCMI